MVRGRQRNVRGGDPLDRPVEVPEAFVSGDGGDFGAPAEHPGVLLDGEQPPGLGQRPEDGSRVERDERSNVDHLGVDAPLGELLRRVDRARHHETEREDGRVTPRATNFRRTERIDDVAVGHLVLGCVESLVLEEEHRIVVPDRGGHETDDVGRGGRRYHLDPGYRHRPVLDRL
jgi:hypothetical protein